MLDCEGPDDTGSHEARRLSRKRQGEAYCQSRGYQHVEIYVEPGASATKAIRDQA